MSELLDFIIEFIVCFLVMFMTACFGHRKLEKSQINFCIFSKNRKKATYQIKSLQCEQNVGCLKNLGMKRWSLMLKMFFFFSAPFRFRCLILILFSCSSVISSSAIFLLVYFPRVDKQLVFFLVLNF